MAARGCRLLLAALLWRGAGGNRFTLAARWSSPPSLLPRPARSYCQEINVAYRGEDYPPLPEYEGATTVPSAEELGELYLVQVRGLPWSCTVNDIIGFFSDCRIRNGAQGVHFLFNRDGRLRGDAVVELETEQDVQKAVKKHRDYLGERYLEVYEMDDVAAKALLNTLQPGVLGPVPSDGVVRLRGLPYSCTEQDIAQFFTGLEIVSEGITFLLDYHGRKTGDAFVQFTSLDMAAKALLKHRKEIGSRYIEIFPSKKSEIPVRRKKEETQIASAAKAVHPANGAGASERDSSSLTLPVKSRKHDAEDTPSMPLDVPKCENSTSVHGVHMRGLPCHITGQDIVSFFHPLTPVKIKIVYGPDGKATGEADVEFAARQDALVAMWKDKSNIHHSCIELFLNSSPN
uniref:G-rich sequence factor 1 n=1 Tax=Geotrypetes seraphini TaxID=260995 RepID=A0A6P8SPY5_GEOSA|nr:G-rich sequence factor 1 [Geotrypetes seraphini]XP_033816946.1 G-rich sequence factor 1 [Geotrypetes seraphini]